MATIVRALWLMVLEIKFIALDVASHHNILGPPAPKLDLHFLTLKVAFRGSGMARLSKALGPVEGDLVGISFQNPITYQHSLGPLHT